MLIALVLFFTRRELVKWISILFHHLHLLDLRPLTCRPFVIWAKCGGTDGNRRLRRQHCWFSAPFSVTMIMTFVPVLTLLRRIRTDVSANKTEAPVSGLKNHGSDLHLRTNGCSLQIFLEDLGKVYTSVPWGIWGAGVTFRDHPVPVEPQPDLLLVFDPVCGLNGQDLMKGVWVSGLGVSFLLMMWFFGVFKPLLCTGAVCRRDMRQVL